MNTPADLASLANRLREHVCTLAREPRNPGSTHHNLAADYTRDIFRSAGWAAEKRESNGPGGRCVNVITQHAVSQDTPAAPLLVVGAHYDTPPGVPGADDNASGVAALLELGRYLSPRLPDIPGFQAAVQLAAYD